MDTFSGYEGAGGPEYKPTNRVAQWSQNDIGHNSGLYTGKRSGHNTRVRGGGGPEYKLANRVAQWSRNGL